MARIGFIGVGKMGRGMCHNLINAGHEMVVFDLNPENTGWFEGRAAIAPSVSPATTVYVRPAGLGAVLPPLILRTSPG